MPLENTLERYGNIVKTWNEKNVVVKHYLEILEL